MRINLNFELESNIINKEYRLTIISFIKHALEKNYKSTYDNIYNKNAKMKAFTFGVFLPDAKINDNNIEIAKNDNDKTYIDVTLSIFDNKIFIELYNSFNSMLNKKYPKDENTKSGIVMTLRKITMQNEKVINKNKILIKFLSPLILRNHNRETNKDTYLTFKDEKFNSLLNQSVERIAKEFNFESSEIKLTPVRMIDSDGNIIQEESKTTVVPFKENLISASFGKFCLEGDITLLNNLYKTGIGSRRSEGFGLFEVL
ncbi:CRISPR-associated endoribonuclease Cas6 [Brachyspira alvinipulli]|uniref:CRISPR-associated endoribonuclease Cas6 n=1 Tax=Brachyspira alvinipulli TaxID=84379 RepID=UPI000488A8B8|nr:CRISPR-associated endoribonuclease Cas6 [Brachyspira alvinipulli]